MMRMRRIMRGLVFSFTQVPALAGIALAQNSFFEPGCQDDPANPTQCIDVGCGQMPVPGQCVPLPAVAPDGQLTQGCVCVPDFPVPDPRACLRVIDKYSGQMVCMDLSCPPTHDRYDCDPITCRCPANRVFQDYQGRCTQSLIDPTMCMDFGCSAQGGVCRPIEAQGPDGQELGGCECAFVQAPVTTCGIYMNPVGILGCYDVACGSANNWECGPVAVCDCTCFTLIPSPDLTMRWLTKTEFIWLGAGTGCATVFNIYRLVAPRMPDLDRNGVADSYGPCRFNGLVAVTANDLEVPPPGTVLYFSVTAEGTAGEGSLGTASNGLLRPNVSPCPTPPPPW